METKIEENSNYTKYIYKDITYCIGKHAKGNTILVQKCINCVDKEEYIWFHDDKESSAHLIVELKNKRKLTINEKKFFASQINKSNRVVTTNIENIKTNKTIGQVTIIDLNKVEIIKL
jgi:hypothetical protein